MAKKETVKKEKKLVMKVAKPVGKKLSKVEFVSFTFGAVIPTQSFGNVQPQIVAKAASYEDARDFAIPKIEELYSKYAEVKPTFLGKITVAEKVIGATLPTAPATQERMAQTPPPAPQPTTPAQTQATNIAPTTEKPAPVLKAEQAIKVATTEEAMLVIQGQIEKSTKIPLEFKQALLTLCLKRRGEITK